MLKPMPASLPVCVCSAAGEALLAFSTTDLECGRTGLFRLHYLLLPCGGGDAGAGAGAGGCRPAALVAKRLASADELAAPLLAPAAPPAGKAAAAAPLSAAVAEVVAGQLARVPLSEQLDPLALSSRCGEMIEVGWQGRLVGLVVGEAWVAPL
jgi:hypothetical protein